MTLIKSISGIRGTIGGPTGDTLNPLDIVLHQGNIIAFLMLLKACIAFPQESADDLFPHLLHDPGIEPYLAGGLQPVNNPENHNINQRKNGCFEDFSRHGHVNHML